MEKFLKQVRLELYLKFNTNPPLYGEWLKYSNAQKSHKIADIGCGNGQLLYEMYACGYKNLEGYDPFIEKDIEINHSSRLFKKDIFEIPSNADFDIIMMHHSFEHMSRPNEIVDKAYELLKPGGLLLIRIPVADAQLWKDYGFIGYSWMHSATFLFTQKNPWLSWRKQLGLLWRERFLTAQPSNFGEASYINRISRYRKARI